MTMKEEPNRHRPLVLHIRRFRQLGPVGVLSQEQLARIAGVTPRCIRELEGLRGASPPLLNLVSVSLALRVRLDELFLPDWVEARRREVEFRRSELIRSNQELLPAYV